MARREFRPGSARILLRAVLADFDLADEPLTFSHSFPACAFLSGRRKGGKLPSLPQGECLRRRHERRREGVSIATRAIRGGCAFRKLGKGQPARHGRMPAVSRRLQNGRGLRPHLRKSTNHRERLRHNRFPSAVFAVSAVSPESSRAPLNSYRFL